MNISNSPKISIFLVRVAMGWMMFYAGITKVLNPEWTSKGYLMAAKSFSGLFQSLASPGMLPITDFVNEWGLTLLGVSLILGIGVRLSGFLGAILMLLYYFPILAFPYPNEHSYIVDEHIIYAAVLLVLATMRSGRFLGFDPMISSRIG